jgi:hypothetical protein
MSLDQCLPDLERKGEIDVGRSREARELYAELKAFYSRSHDEQTAAALASQATVERLEAAAAHKKANLVRQVKAQQSALAAIRTFNGQDPAATNPLDPRGAEALLAFDSRAGHNDSVFARERAIRGRAHGFMVEILARHRQKFTGNNRDPAGLEDLVREVFEPGSTGKALARELADAFTRGTEYLRARFNEAGGQIGKLEGWFPQSHSAALVRKAGFAEWRNFVTPLLDRSKIFDRRTGRPFTDEAFEPFLRNVWETLRTDGWSKVEPGAAGGKMVANQRGDHRILHFADGDAWLAYHERFGSGTPFDAMMGHVDGMSRDIALMEILGPNPAATIRWLKDSVLKSAQLDGSPDSKAIAAAEKGVPKIQRLYDELTGTLRRPESEKIALGFSAVRSVQVAAKLGSAILSALPTDPAFGAITRKFNGLPAWRMFGGYLKQLNPLDDADRKLAVRAGLIAEEWSHMTAAQHRILAEELTGEWSRRLASGVLRISGLAAYTQAGRWAFGMEFLGHLTDQAGKSFDQLDAPLARAMQRHGIGADTWEIIRKTPIEEHRGAGWILPQNIEDRQAGDRLLQMIQTETDFAVPLADPRTRAMMNSAAPRGTWFGEVIRSALLFKTFGITLLMTHGRRMLEQSGVSAARYAAGFFIATTLGGAAAIQLKEISKGKDPKPMPGADDPLLDHAAFWGAAQVQGGGLGIYGDFLKSSENRFGGGIGSTLAGPMAQTATNVGGLAFSSTKAAMGDKKAKPGRDLVKLIKQETPGSSLWFSRVAFERLIADQLQEELDPEYRKSWRAIERRAAQEGQEFWWEPGETSPDRAPEIGLGGRQQ